MTAQATPDIYIVRMGSPHEWQVMLYENKEIHMLATCNSERVASIIAFALRQSGTSFSALKDNE
jgi:hypothetical protein